MAINGLPSVTTVSAGDQIAISSAQLGSDARASMSALIPFLQSQGIGAMGVYLGAVPDEASMLALNANVGDKTSRTDFGGGVFELIALPPTLLANWLSYGGAGVDGGTFAASTDEISGGAL